jgi:ectoine hydroxylase-related dioxygenase (phytanoyl-CoA dioxygenase family)
MKKAVNIFKQSSLNQALEENGYVIVPFLSEEEIIALQKFFFEHHPILPEGMYASSHSPDFDLRQKMNNAIRQKCARAIEQTFVNCTPLGATFMVKSKGANGSLKPHQDWSIVDEKRFNSYNIWLPLVDVNEKNGTLLILPKSHSFIENIRGLNIASSYEQVENEVWKYLLPLNVKAGDAVVYDHRLLHASGINKTNQTRLTVVYGIVPEKAEMLYYFGNKGKIEVYQCTPEFYFSQEINQGPIGLEQIAVLDNNNPLVTPKELQFFKPLKKNWWQRFWH